MIEGKHVLVTGGTGSLGRTLVKRLLSGREGLPASVTVFSRDEAKQDQFRQELMGTGVSTDEVIYKVARDRVRFRIGSVTDRSSLAVAMRPAQIVFHAAALKQVPSCEYQPVEAVRTNIDGAANVIDIIAAERLAVEVVVGVSTDKACKPVNVMGMTKAIQERVFVEANLRVPGTRFVLARYGNVLASRGSVIPLFHQQIAAGGPLTITTPLMTRFFMSLEQAVDTVLEAMRHAAPGEIVIPRVPSALLVDVAAALIGDRPVEVRTIGIRPGEKVHEALVSEEEASRTLIRGNYLVICPMLPQLLRGEGTPWEGGEYASSTDLLDVDGVRRMLETNRLRIEDLPFSRAEELLR
ncbi:MAG: polysaccharide biosynthesis protein [Thermoanaerobaculia bacterium]|jgi:UDP-glucose 4-epimerase